MDWNAAIEKHREALKRILAALVALAGLAGGSGTLPRHLHRAVLRLLRPAESAARRLVIVAARGIVVSPPPPRSAWSPSPASQGRIDGDAGTTWILPRSRGVSSRFAEGKSIVPVARWKASERRDAAQQRGPGRQGTAEGGGGDTAMRALTLPLFDPLRLPRPRRPAASGVPRISVPGFTAPFPVAPRRPPAPDDPVDSARLGRRLAALASVLDDLPAHARRFARWRASRDAKTEEPRSLPQWRARPRRIWPLRPGRPPGWRRRPEHEVHEVLNAAHGLAFWALNRPDTS